MKVAFDVKLSQERWGGVEKQFARLLRATRTDPRIDTYLFSRFTPDRHEEVIEALASLSKPPFDPRHIGPLVVPRALRVWRQARYARRQKIDVVVNINRFRSVDVATIAAQAGAKSVYWERGAAWFNPAKPLKHDFERAFDLYLANSQAARAMLRYVWKVEKPIEILAPAVWEFDPNRLGRTHHLDAGRPLRLGFAGRLRAFKGGVLAVHTVAALRKNGIEAELLVAGQGADADFMRRAAENLGVADAVRFLGVVSDMVGFFDGIDVLLHPALREPYGNIAAEAQCFGVPVVTTFVDGLPEVVADRETGICVDPDLEREEFASYGGDVSDVYALVYHPVRPANGASTVAEGRIEAPRFASPTALAEAVAAVVSSAEVYSGYSERAVTRARTTFTPSVHIDRLIERMQLATSL